MIDTGLHNELRRMAGTADGLAAEIHNTISHNTETRDQEFPFGYYDAIEMARSARTLLKAIERLCKQRIEQLDRERDK